MPALTQPEATFKQILEEMGFSVKFFEDRSPDDSESVYMQVPVLSYRMDFACPEKKIAIEIDGEFWHGSAFMPVTASQLERKLHDAQQNKELENDGWTVFRIPASCLGNERLKPRLIKYVQALFTTK